MLKCLIGRQTGWWFQTFGLYSIIYGNIWDNPSHWLIFFKMVETTNQWLQCSFWAVPPRISAPQTLMTDWNWSYKNINSGYNHAPGHLAENTNKVTRNGLACVYMYIYTYLFIFIPIWQWVARALQRLAFSEHVFPSLKTILSLDVKSSQIQK